MGAVYRIFVTPDEVSKPEVFLLANISIETGLFDWPSKYELFEHKPEFAVSFPITMLGNKEIQPTGSVLCGDTVRCIGG